MRHPLILQIFSLFTLDTEPFKVHYVMEDFRNYKKNGIPVIFMSLFKMEQFF